MTDDNIVKDAGTAWIAMFFSFIIAGVIGILASIIITPIGGIIVMIVVAIFLYSAFTKEQRTMRDMESAK